METGLYILITLIFILSIILLIWLNKKVNLVSTNSEKLEKLAKLNESIKFNYNIKKKITIFNYVTNKNEFSKAELDEIMKEEFLDNTSNSLVNFELVNKNANNYESYIKKYKNITNKTSSDIIKITNLSEKLFYLIEKNLFKKRQAKPIVKTKINLVVKFDNLKEKNNYKKKKVYNFDDLRGIYDKKNNI